MHTHIDTYIRLYVHIYATSTKRDKNAQEAINCMVCCPGAVAMAFAQQFPERVIRMAAISPAGFVPRVPPLYYLLRSCWCCLIPLAPHVVCTCWYKKERFTRCMLKLLEHFFREESSDFSLCVVGSCWQESQKRSPHAGLIAVEVSMPLEPFREGENSCGIEKPGNGRASNHKSVVAIRWKLRSGRNEPVNQYLGRNPLMESPNFKTHITINNGSLH